MKIRYLFLLLAFSFNTGWADFSDALFRLHPMEPAFGGPYLIEITGEWPDDCHPGEQKPVIRDYTGDTALIEFETIVEHVICNDVPTPYRVLVDMSDVIDNVTGSFTGIEVILRFGETEFTKSLALLCICSPAPIGPDIKPEAGLYYSDGLEKQGLLLARQNQRMGAFPLIYDEAGSSEWLIGAGGIVEDVFFADLFESTGGQCLGCLPPDDPPQMGVVGKISMLMDSEGVIQVKINDGLFETYEPTDFGYGSKDIGGLPNRKIPDLSGRWAFVEDVVKAPQLPPSDTNTSLIPLVFDIALISVSVVAPPIVTAPPTPPGYVMFSVRDKGGVEVAQMKCDYGSDWQNYEAEMVCNVYNADINDGDTLYQVKMLSVERLSFSWVGPTIPEIPLGTPIAVRID